VIVEYILSAVIIAIAIGVLIKLRIMSKRISKDIRANLQERERRLMSLGTGIRDLENEMVEKDETIAVDPGEPVQGVDGDSDPEHDDI